jgi:hypothetical protein
MDAMSYVLALEDEAVETALVRPNQGSSLIAFFSVLLKFVHRLQLVFWGSDTSLSYAAISVGLGLNNRLSYVVILQWH